ncbi:MAG: PmoA family protein [Planctomycetales bacterium]|nr:PmoA family protein [Planctomycetales bacterium]
MEDVDPIDDCQIVPLPGKQFQFLLGGNEVTRWHASHDVPGPYFYPIQGKHGVGLTRMGHPGAPNHDHHRSFWFAHNDLLGIDFWSEETSARIRQSQWLAIEDGDSHARLAVELFWQDGHDPTPILKQTVFFTLRRGEQNKQVLWTLELQSEFQAQGEGVEFRQSNFGILGLRVAKSLSVVFGSGKILGADGNTGERQLFGQPNRWIDYSGPVGRVNGKPMVEGLALIDHRSNPGHEPAAWAAWHIRDDGWIGPSLSRHGPVSVPTKDTLCCRYLLAVHEGDAPTADLNRLADRFDASKRLRLVERPKPHHQWAITDS